MEKHYEFQEKLKKIHRPDRVNDTVWKQIEGQVIDETWAIVAPPDAGIVLNNAAKDLQDYFQVSMGLHLELVSHRESKQIRLQVSLTGAKSLYRVAVEEGSILLDGTDERMSAQAAYALEDQMNMNEGPVLRLQDQVYEPLFTTRLIESGVEEDCYPDEHLCAIAHAGINGITLDTSGVNENDEVRDRVNDIIARAAAFGIDVYTFPAFKNQRHPSDADAWEHYDGMYGELFRRCPGLKGVIVVGEVCEFPSHDERTTGKTWRESLQDEKSSPGWFPCNDYPQFATLLRDVIHNVKPEARFVFWSYNWGYMDTDLRLELIDAMPAEGVTLMATYEMFEKFRPRPGVEENCVDYTLFFEGPGEYFSTELEAASERNIDFMAMSNTGGNTWDIGMVPYLPAPGQWIRRYENILADRMKHPNFTSLRESHSYGFWPSFVPELAKAAFTEPRQDLNSLLRAIAVRDYGAEHADTVLEAWEHFSEGMRHCVPTNEEQYGPCRVGPSYPLFFEKWEPIPIGPESKRDPNWTCCSVYRFNPDEMERLVYEIEEYEKMTAEFAAGNRLLASVIPALPGNKKPYAREALTVSRFIENTARTTVHVKRWHKAKIHLGVYVDHEAIWSGGRHGMKDALSPVKPLDVRPDRENWIRELMAIGEAEIQNAKDTIPLVQANSRLGYTQELDYGCSEEQLLWKIDRLERTLAEEIQPNFAEVSNEL